MNRRAFLLGAIAAPVAAPALAQAAAEPVAGRIAGGVVRGGPFIVGEQTAKMISARHFRIMRGAATYDFEGFLDRLDDSGSFEVTMNGGITPEPEI